MNTENTTPALQQGAAQKGLTGTGLKTIALVLMVVDHIHYFFEFTGAIPTFFSMLGRLSAPLFLFCLVEGFAHTHSRPKYLLRVWLISAGMGLLQFYMQWGGYLNRGDGFYPQNAIFMNFVILMCIWQGMDWLKARKILPGLAAILLPLAWALVSAAISRSVPALGTAMGIVSYTLLPSWGVIVDGGLFYILQGVLLYALRGNRKVQLAVWGAVSFLFNFVYMGYLFSQNMAGFGLVQMFTTYYSWMEIFALPLMACYNGKRGKGWGRGFYIFYPAHVYLLYGASCLVYAAFFVK
ncbi:MAG: TraX family protein [Gemmiger sp.]|nr:TraX family protein [Gemmiger sp.]